MERNSIKFKIYSKDKIPNKKTAQQISYIFIKNYPEVYSKKTKERDLKRYDTPEKIQKQIEEGNIWIAASIKNKIVGLEKFRPEKRKQIKNSEEFLCSWTIVDKNFRKKGIAIKLIKKFLSILKKIKKQTSKRIFAIGDIHRKNIASRNLAEKLGFDLQTGKNKDFLFVIKEIK